MSKLLDLNGAREMVATRLGHEWTVRHVSAELVPGPAVGSPTQQRVSVVLDFNMEGRPSTTDDGFSAWSVGPHLVYEGTGPSLEGALAVAFGNADADEERREQAR